MEPQLHDGNSNFASHCRNLSYLRFPHSQLTIEGLLVIYCEDFGFWVKVVLELGASCKRELAMADR